MICCTAYADQDFLISEYVWPTSLGVWGALWCLEYCIFTFTYHRLVCSGAGIWISQVFGKSRASKNMILGYNDPGLISFFVNLRNVNKFLNCKAILEWQRTHLSPFSFISGHISTKLMQAQWMNKSSHFRKYKMKKHK